MADGFLSPDGVFYSKEETYHAETARRILNAGKDVLEPIQELLRQGYIAFIEFRNPLAKESLQPDLDYVLCSHGHTLTPEQEEWLEHNQDMISRISFLTDQHRVLILKTGAARDTSDQFVLQQGFHSLTELSDNLFLPAKHRVIVK